MNRQEAVSLLKQMVVVCKSFDDARSISIERNNVTDGWELHVNFIPSLTEIAILEKIVDEKSLEMVMFKGKMIFRSIP